MVIPVSRAAPISTLTASGEAALYSALDRGRSVHPCMIVSPTSAGAMHQSQRLVLSTQW
jgi:hypothetical protein